MKKTFAWFATALIAALAFTAGVRADNIPWGYGAISPPDIMASSSPLSSIQMVGSSGSANGNSGIIIYNMTTTSFNDGVAQPPDTFSNVPFDLAITLSDIKALSASTGTIKTTGVVNFSGLFNATNVTDKSLLPGMPGWNLVPGNATETEANIVLGASDPTVGWRNYKIVISSFTAPGQPGGAPGSIQAIVSITPADGPGGSGEGPPTNATPEPASLLLAGLGVPLVVLVRRRMKKNA